MATKRVRSGRASDAQLAMMVQFFECNKGIAEGKFHILNGKEELKKKWDELSNELNSLKGATKTSAQWQVTWRDLKSRTSQKARKIRLGRNQTGNKEIEESSLTPLELRIIGIVGTNYVEGSSDCPDSIPEEEDIQEQLAAGDSSALLRPPKVTSIFNNISNTAVQQLNLENGLKRNENPSDDPTDWDTVQYINYDENIEESAEIPLEFREEITEESRQTETLNVVSQQSCAVTATVKARPYLRSLKRKIPATTSNVSSPNPRRLYRERQSQQLASARDQFAAISESHAQSMLMLAEAAKLQSDAAKHHADAMSRLAEAMEKQADAALQHAANDKARIHVMTQLVDVLSQILPTYSS